MLALASTPRAHSFTPALPGPARTIDPTDVPVVTASGMIRALVGAVGSAPVSNLAAELEAGTLARIEAALWRTQALSAERTAIMVRLRALAAVLAARRFAPLLARHGERLTGPALAAAASLRLNAVRGFNPVQMMWALAAAAAAIEAEAAVTPPNQDETLPLAA